MAVQMVSDKISPVGLFYVETEEWSEAEARALDNAVALLADLYDVAADTARAEEIWRAAMHVTLADSEDRRAEP